VPRVACQPVMTIVLSPYCLSHWVTLTRQIPVLAARRQATMGCMSAPGKGRPLSGAVRSLRPLLAAIVAAAALASPRPARAGGAPFLTDDPDAIECRSTRRNASANPPPSKPKTPRLWRPLSV